MLSYLVTEAFAVSVARAAVSEEITVAPTEEKKKCEEGKTRDTVRLFFSIDNVYGVEANTALARQSSVCGKQLMYKYLTQR